MGERRIKGMLNVVENSKNMIIVNPYRFKPGDGIPRNGLIGEWLFNGNANDTSGKNYHGVLINSPSFENDRKNNPNASLQITSTNQAVQISDNNDLDLNGSYSISLWVYDNSALFANGRYLSKLIGNGYEMYRSGPYIFRVSHNGSLFQTSNNYVTPSTWQHIVITYDHINELINSYLNTSFNEQLSPLQNINTTATDLYIGNRLQLDRGFIGLIDDVRIYNRVLTIDEITALYNE